MIKVAFLFLVINVLLIDADLRAAFLTADNPTYAIHGLTLDFYEQVRIESCTNCHLTFDVTFRETPNEISFSYDGKTALYNCVSNSLNDGIDNMTQCSWIYDQGNTVLKIGSTTRFEFGISIRVQEWTEDSVDLKLMPIHAYVNASYSTSVITIGSKTSQRAAVATFVARNAKYPCTHFLDARVSPDSCVYDIVAGGAPSKSGNLLNLLQRLNATTSLLTSRILSSAFSVILPAGCEATLQFVNYQSTAAVTGFMGPGKFFITSPNYPWNFDEGKTVPTNYSQMYLPISYKDTMSVDFWFDRIEGGFVTVNLVQYTQEGNVWNELNATLDVLTNGNLTGSSGQGLVIGWFPKREDEGRKGFVCRIVAYDYRPSPSDTITTTPATTGVTVTGNNLTTTTALINPGSFTYNGKTALYNCAPNSLDDGMDTMTQCTWAYNQSSTVLKIGATTRFEFGISVRVQEWTEDSFDVKLMPVHEYVNATMSTSKITVGSKDARRGTVATFLARSPKEPCTYFLNAYVVPASCVYEIVAGGAPGTHGNLRNLLQRLNATTSLLTSRILSSAFSVVIPAGCEATLQVLDYQTTAEVTSFFGPGKFIITSPNYPWIFDEGKTAPANYSQLYLPITYKDTYSVDFWLDRIEGSYVSIFLEQYTQQGTVSNMFNATMNVLTNGNLTGSADGLACNRNSHHDISVHNRRAKLYIARPNCHDHQNYEYYSVLMVFLHFIFFSVLFYISSAALLLPVVNLTVENPSYAIHGLSLDWYKQVTINSSPGCTLIFDVTIRAETALYNCVESKLKDGIDNMTVCSWPYSKDSTILRIGDTNIYEFGISIRVKEWTEASFDVVPMPVHAYVNDSIATSMITVGAENSTRGTIATFVARNPTVPCTIFLASSVTPNTCIYDVVAGGSPSGQGNPSNLLQRVEKGFLCRGVAYDYREAPTAWPITESPTSPDEPSSSENPAPTPTSAPILTTSKTSANHFLQLSSLVLIYLLLA
ncbi:unnamed protein product, partial [Mesorhabditis spiculigera]